MRFVLLEHELPNSLERRSHFDLMLQLGDDLLTWELPVAALQSDGECQANRLADHRLAYLDYEGLVSGGRGTVQQVVGGCLTWLRIPSDSLPHGKAKLVSRDSGCWEVELRGISGANWVVSWKRVV